MLRLLLAFVRPLHAIARDIHAIREIYEQWGVQQSPPIYLVTEKPHKSDTEVSYMGVDEEPKRPHRLWFTE